MRIAFTDIVSGRRGLALVAAAGLHAAGCAGPLPDEGAQGPTAPAPVEAAAPAAPAQPEVPAEATPAAEPAAPARAEVVLDTDTLRLESTPDIPASMRERLEQYLETRAAELSDISADGRRLLITTRFGETSQVHLVEQPMGARTQLTFAPEPAAQASFVPGGGAGVVYVADIGGNEQFQLWHLDRATGRRTRLTDADSRNGVPRWSPDGAQLAYASNSRNKRDFDIWVGDGRDPGSARRLVDGSGWWYPVDWSPDGSKLIVGEYISANESHLHLVDVASGQVTRLSPEGKATYESAQFAADGRRIYVASDREGEFTELYETDLGGSGWRSLTRDIPWDVVSVDLSSDGRTLAFTTNEDGLSVLYLLDTRTRRSRRVPGLPAGLIGDLQFARRAPVLAFTVAGATRPGDVFTYDLRRRALTQWTASELGGLDREALVEPELIRFETFDGKQIPAFYYKPAGAGPFPVIVNIHGGPEGQARPVFSSLTQYLVNESGVAMLYPNVRGSSGYGKSYLLLDNGMKREDSVKDIGALLDWIAARPELDARRVGVLGGSYGGYMVLATLVHFGQRIAAGVDVVGISNFVTFLENTAEYRRDLRRVEYGDERDPEMRAHLEQISPLRRAAEIQSALFVVQGANDPRVPASEAEQIVAAVRGAGQDVWYMLAKNEGHGFRKKDNRDLYTLLTVMFFEKQLGVSR
ncbi:S9 family peptidase [Haliangium sp.]|uniref:S9 family peptidase n=1 Tax=Haliangium sp. TaxID=2663208 RepID=UPI003D097201